MDFKDALGGMPLRLQCDSCNKKYKTSDKLAAYQNTHRVQSASAASIRSHNHFLALDETALPMSLD
jgi:hypothetical protein